MMREWSMTIVVEAEVDSSSNIRPTVLLRLPQGARLVIAMVDHPCSSDTALFSESSLASDWGRPEEEAAWGALACS